MKKFLKIFLAIIVILFIIFGNAYSLCSESCVNDVVTQEIEPQLKEEVQARETVVEEPKVVYMGNFVATAYCICYDCCGKTPEHPAYGITASGKRATPGRTVAVDPYIVPLGSTVIVKVDGKEYEYIAEDTGSAIKGNKVDICYESHEQAKQFGRRIVEVKVIY